jgi:uncharacterized protein YndB with AHSA1/START domain
VDARSEIGAAADYELSIIRIFDAPRDLVFAAWTDPKHMARWAGPRGFTSTDGEMDVRPGGIHRASLRAPDGTIHRVRGVYREIVAPERLVFTHAWEDENGDASPETIVTVTLAEREGKTRMMFHQAIFESKASRDGHGQGWSQSFDRLAELLALL